MLLASALGAGGFIWWVTALISMVFPDKRAAAWRLLLAVMLSWCVTDLILKPLVARPRPFKVDTSITIIDAQPTTAAFPSGHAAMAVAGAVAGSRMIPWSAWAWWPLALVVAVSRVYIGVHWPSDVAAGAMVGLATAWFALGGPPIRRINSLEQRI
jgi:undecaprenyl-diphosphatase